MILQRRLLLVSLMLVAFGLTSAPDGAYGDNYPGKPITIIVPFATGGPNDIVARIIGRKLAERLGQPVLIDNRPGAGGSIGASMVAKSTADGYTLLLVGTSFGMQPSLYSKLNFDTLKDFKGVIWLVEAQTVLMVTPSLPVKSIKELISLAKTKPGRLIYASNGIGSAAHLRGELFKSMTGIDLVHVPYKGNSPLLVDLLAGRVQLGFVDTSLGASYSKTGKLRALAVSGARRSAILPDIPTMAETNVAGFESSTWFGIVAPAETPREIIKKLNIETVRILRLPDVKEYMTDKGFLPKGSTPEEFDAHIYSEVTKWAKVVKQAGIPVED